MGAFLCKLLCLSLHVNSIDGWVLYQELTAPYILWFVLVTFHCYVIAPDKDNLREESTWAPRAHHKIMGLWQRLVI